MKKLNALLVDDDIRFCRTFEALSSNLFNLSVVHHGKDAWKQLAHALPDVVFLDYKLGKGTNGLEVLKKIKKKFPHLPVIMITDFADVEIAVEAMKLGAFHYTSKSPNIEALALIIQRQLEQLQKQFALESQLREQEAEIVHKSLAMQEIQQKASQIAKTTTTVIITGECGVGKEVLARQIHRWGDRKDKPFVAINCSTLASQLFESEFFGHEKGAFTDAHALKKGKLELANSGTVFLDEIGDLPLESQAKILRAIEEKRFERLGGVESIEVDVRIIAATNKDLRKMVEQNLFREDLFYRLSVVDITIPPLRQRIEDIEPLTKFFLQKFSREMGLPIAEISPEALKKLQSYNWPGNVRELKNHIERILAFHRSNDPIGSEEIQLENTDKEYEFPEELFHLNYADAKNRLMQEFQKIYFKRALRENNGNVSATAEQLGMHRSALHRLIRELGVK
ncbi:MAG: sigma-54-dependent Fis family transcriptional regulator [Calditrichaeota bacterium]|nr:sigma-54-dependent Fis family transcriptional regulator [Calditrichota bacterium]